MAERQYTVQDLQLFKAHDHVRRRPAMYVGGVGARALHVYLTALLDNPADEALEGNCSSLVLRLEADGSIVVQDDGLGISVARGSASGSTTLEQVFTGHSACSWSCEQRHDHRRGLFGIGAFEVNALSELLVVETSREGVRYRMRFERGERVGELEALGPCGTPGTMVRLRPDRTIFASDAELDRARLQEEMHALAALIPGLAVELIDHRFPAPFEATYHCRRGLADLVQTLTETPRLAVPIQAVATEDWPEDDATAEIRMAIQFQESDTERRVGFVNRARADEGTHIDGLIQGFELGLADAAAELGLTTPTQRPQGMLAALAVCVPEPQFEGATRECLGTPEILPLVQRVARRAVSDWARGHPNEARGLLSR